MDDVKLKLDEKGNDKFYIADGEKQLGGMEINISGDRLTVYHTEVIPEAEGQGLAKKMLAAMVDHARKNKLKVIPLCPYVHAQFKRHADDYADVWNHQH
jgi:predicted GNAT family acetyltransferase